MSEPKRAALLLAHGQPETPAEKRAFAAQYLACRLSAGNHDMTTVGLYAPAGAVAPPGDPELLLVEPGAFDLVLAAPSPLGDANGAWFAGALEQLRTRHIDVVLIDRTGL